MHAELVMIGTELLLGEIVDTNANRLARELRSIGLDLFYKTTVDDNENRITAVLNLALDRSDVIITSGGLGPTVDDITRQAVANATGRKLIYSAELEEQIAARFRSFGRKMADNNKRQAYIPEGARPLPNPVGTAPCFLCEDSKGRGVVISLPGVPRELDYMMEHTVTPLLIERMGGRRATRVRVLRTCAVGESNVDRAIGDLMTGDNPSVGLSAHSGQTDVRITARADTEEAAAALIAPLESKLRQRLGVAIYGTGKETVPEVVGRLMSDRGLRLGVFDTLTQGQVVRELIEAGHAGSIAGDLSFGNMEEAVAAVGLDAGPDAADADKASIALALAERVVPARGVGLAMVGPFQDNTTVYAVCGPGKNRWSGPGRNFQDTPYARRWLVIQGLDWVRRALLDQLTSPADWN